MLVHTSNGRLLYAAATCRYVANDVMQSSRSKGGDFIKAFANVLPDCYRRIATGPRDAAHIRSVTRLVTVWMDRNVFPQDFCTKLLQYGNLKGATAPAPAAPSSGRPTMPAYGTSAQSATAAAPTHPLAQLESSIADAERNSGAAAQVRCCCPCVRSACRTRHLFRVQHSRLRALTPCCCCCPLSNRRQQSQ